MALFTYVSHSADGQPLKGTIEADDALSARSALREMNLDVEELHELPDNFTLVSDAPSSVDGLQVPASSESSIQTPQTTSAVSRGYYPLIDTLRLYAGWLLAWYFLIEILGTYQQLRHLPFQIPYVESLIDSPTVIGFSFAAFFFLFLSSLHRAIGGGKLLGFFFALLGIGVVSALEMSLGS